MLLSLPAAALAACLLSPSPAPSLDQSFLDQWGTIVSCGGGLYFESNGNIYGLATTGSFQDGDAVYVIGTGGTSGAQPCPQANEFFPHVTVSAFDPIVEMCACPAALSCSNVPSSVGCPNSTGAGARLDYTGMPSVTTAFYGLDLFVGGLPANEAGLVFMGGMSAPPLAPGVLGDGLLCVGGAAGFFRYPIRSASSSGSFTEPDVVGTSQAFAAAGRITVGSTWFFQAWYRDPAGPCGNGSNTTNGLQITFMP